jgi:WD40 repeat protein
VYTADGSFRQVKKKRFAGHTIAGYACKVAFSPDGKYISSGTGSGDLVFWDWKTGKIAKRLKGHKEVVIDHAWLPNEHVRIIVNGRREANWTVKSRYRELGWVDQAVELIAYWYMSRRDTSMYEWVQCSHRVLPAW